MTSNPFRWLAIRTLKARAQELAAPTLSAVALEMAGWQALAAGPTSEYLRNQLNSSVKELRKSHKAMNDACVGGTLERVGIEWLNKVLEREGRTAQLSGERRAEHEGMQARIKKADVEMSAMYAKADSLPAEAAKENRDSIAAIRRLRTGVAHEKHQREFNVVLREMENEIQQHAKWLAEMESARTQMQETGAQFDHLLSSTAWMTTKGAADNVDRAQMNLRFAARSWEAGSWTRATYFVVQAIAHIENARNFCDRTWNQAREEITMWTKFLAVSKSYPQMKQTVESFRSELPPGQLQAWLDYRRESEREIQNAASESAGISACLPSRTVPALKWTEERVAQRQAFAAAVVVNSKETIGLLVQRHRKRRKRYKSPSV